MRDTTACARSRRMSATIIVRVRLGIGHPGEQGARAWVTCCGNFTKADRAWVDPLLDAIAQAAPYLADGDEAGFMNKVTLLTAPPRKNRSRSRKEPKRQGE